jgi:hypothetical protein
VPPKGSNATFASFRLDESDRNIGLPVENRSYARRSDYRIVCVLARDMVIVNQTLPRVMFQMRKAGINALLIRNASR